MLSNVYFFKVINCVYFLSIVQGDLLGPRLTAHPNFMASKENTVTLPNENTEEEPMAPVGRKSDNRKSVSFYFR